MMKRILACLLVAACLLTGFALAEEEPTPTLTMKVIKCKQAVNLRKGPSTDTASLGMVPLDTELHGCVATDGSDWVMVTYEGQTGYIRSDFLELIAIEEPEEIDLGPIAERELPMAAPVQTINDATNYTDDDIILEETIGGVRVMAREIFMEANEYLLIVGLDASGNQVWKRETATYDVSEMTQTAAFIGGTADAPLVMMYNDWLGLSALDPATGDIRWELRKEDVFLGGSISYVVDGSGTLYVGGYYEPEPVAIDANGNVLWQADSGAAAPTWMYNLELGQGNVTALYGSMSKEDGEETSGAVTYGLNGAVQQILYD